MVFGSVTKGMDVVKKVESFGSAQGRTSKPVVITDCGCHPFFLSSIAVHAYSLCIAHCGHITLMKPYCRTLLLIMPSAVLIGKCMWLQAAGLSQAYTLPQPDASLRQSEVSMFGNVSLSSAGQSPCLLEEMVFSTVRMAGLLVAMFETWHSLHACQPMMSASVCN